MRAAIECDRVGFAYTKRPILHEISLRIQAGEMVGLLGPNGAGKTTMLRIIAGMLRPEAGHVRVLGQAPGWRTLFHTALLPERGHLPGWLTVGEWFTHARRLYPDWSEESERRLVADLALRLDRPIARLSRGEVTRVGLVTCLARRAEVVLLDEPFTGIDPLGREIIASAMVRECGELGRTVLMATHDVRELEPLFDRVLFLKDGSIAADETADAIRARGLSVASRYREVFSP
ncbi:ABC transporter ATP-binding protein [Alicyclobacillus sendaiensis]|uniref:ABC transporter ATP-binding protein n=1 Tax=Alicyclobacillus sendaiensis PA2 TaxID=3029425 RepID=A0ABT6Y080_ALISE|nr:ABC transporter ATP-binding protein [Alicyclobacillus sendaiensis]MDI9260677.1 ABC transporter ATP-binding protein [Alicyclobacillus sendaiensis PA2]